MQLYAACYVVTLPLIAGGATNGLVRPSVSSVSRPRPQVACVTPTPQIEHGLLSPRTPATNETAPGIYPRILREEIQIFSHIQPNIFRQHDAPDPPGGAGLHAAVAEAVPLQHQPLPLPAVHTQQVGRGTAFVLLIITFICFLPGRCVSFHPPAVS